MENYVVMKFGGTSVGSAQRMQEVYQLVKAEKRPKVVVLSAMSGTTNTLVEYCRLLSITDFTNAEKVITTLQLQYKQTIKALYKTPDFIKKGTDRVDGHFTYLLSFLNMPLQARDEKAILAQGEMLSTAMFTLFLEELGCQTSLLYSPDFIRVNEDGEPDLDYIPLKLSPLLEQHKGNFIITQGFICTNRYGEIDNLRRGGSDYTASLIGAAIEADEIQIWTDIDGMHNNDPRIVEGTKPIQSLSFEEAAELAYFGAKILHPSTVLPAKRKRVPVRLLNTMQPQALGTYISAKTDTSGVMKAIAAKDNITALRIRSGRMLMAYGFLRKVFEIFERYKTSIDLITTSEVAISITIDDDTHLRDIVAELELFSEVEIDTEQTVICVVGQDIGASTGMSHKIFKALESIFIRMISFGGSNHNISVLVDAKDKVAALQLLNKSLFN